MVGDGDSRGDGDPVPMDEADAGGADGEERVGARPGNAAQVSHAVARVFVTYQTYQDDWLLSTSVWWGKEKKNENHGDVIFLWTCFCADFGGAKCRRETTK